MFLPNCEKRQSTEKAAHDDGLYVVVRPMKRSNYE